jgi:hypothetical protein
MRAHRTERTHIWSRSGVGLAAVALLASVLVMVLAGCGKPGYCSDRTNLEQSVKDLGNVKLTESGGVDRLKSQLKKIQSDTKQVVSSAKSDFPSETDQLNSSVSALEKSAQALPSSPSASELKGLVTEVAAVAGASQTFVSATDSKCS